jgi:hypothetical protein
LFYQTAWLVLVNSENIDMSVGNVIAALDSATAQRAVLMSIVPRWIMEGFADVSLETIRLFG